MSITIYEKTPSGLYATGDRTVSTFPSGLVRVEQTFVCKTSAAATHRAALTVGTNMPGGNAPAIDGLKIFPEPQEKQRGDGFTEFVVSAYGRTTITGLTTFRWKTFFESGSYGGVNYTAIMRNKEKKVELVVPTSEIATFTFNETGATTPVKIEGYYNPDAQIWQLGVTDYSTQNFGSFTEIAYTIGAYKLASV